MPKLEKKKSTEQVPLLNTTILSVELDKEATFEYLGAEEAFEKPKLLLRCLRNNKRYDFSLNATNKEILGDKLEEIGEERDTDKIPVGTEMTLEVIDTGAQGQFQYGIRFKTIVFPK